MTKPEPDPRVVAMLTLALLLASACGPERVRSQSRFFTVHHAVLFTDADGRGSYVLELQSVRRVPPLSIVEITMERPGRPPWRKELTVEAGQRRFPVTSPTFEGFRPGTDYNIRVRLIGFDRHTVVDHLRQRVRPTVQIPPQ